MTDRRPGAVASVRAGATLAAALLLAAGGLALSRAGAETELSRDPDPTEASEDLLEIGLAREAAAGFSSALRETGLTAPQQRRARLGLAAALASDGRVQEALDLLSALAARDTAARASALEQALALRMQRWDLDEASALARALLGDPSTAPNTRRRAALLSAGLSVSWPLRAQLDERFAEAPADGWLVADPRAVTWDARRRVVHFRAGARDAREAYAEPFGLPTLETVVPLSGEAFSLEVTLTLRALGPGGQITFGVAAPGAVADGLELQLAASPPHHAGPGARRDPWLRLVRRAGRRVLERRVPCRGLALDVAYRVRLVYLAALGAARAEVREIGSDDATPATAPAPLCSVRLPVDAPLAPGGYRVGILPGPARLHRGVLEAEISRIRLSGPVRVPGEAGPKQAIGDGSAERRYLEGNAALAFGRREAAVRLLRGAVSADPDLDVAHYALGVALREADARPAAARAFATVLRTIPRARVETRRIVQALEVRGAEREARDVVMLARRVDPADPSLLAAWQRLRARELDLLRDGAVRAADPRTLILRAEAFLQLESPSDAERSAGQALRALDEDPAWAAASADLALRGRLARARARLAGGDLHGATLDAYRARSSATRDPRVYHLLGRCLAQSGDAAAASLLFARACALSPDDLPSWLSLGSVALAMGDLATAEQAARRARTLGPRHPEAYALAARIALKRNAPTAARALVRRALRYGPVDAELSRAALRSRTRSRTRRAFSARGTPADDARRPREDPR